MTDAQPRQATPADIDLVELRVGLAGLTAEVQRMRVDLSALAALPTQLTAVAELHAERLTNLDARLSRELVALHASVEAADARRRAGDRDLEQRLGEDIKGLQDWQTWAMRVVLGLVVAAVLGAVLVTP